MGLRKMSDSDKKYEAAVQLVNTMYRLEMIHKDVMLGSASVRMMVNRLPLWKEIVALRTMIEELTK